MVRHEDPNDRSGRERQIIWMRTALFWVFVPLFAAIVVCTILMIFAGIGSPAEGERKLLMTGFLGEIGVFVIALGYSLFRLRRKPPDADGGEPRAGAVPPAHLSAGLTDDADGRGLAGITHASPDRRHSSFPDRYWDQASSSVSLFAPTLWKSIMGLGGKGMSAEMESLHKTAIRLRSKLRILLMSPDSAAFEAHMDLLSTVGDVPQLTRDEYRAKLKLLEPVILEPGARIRYYKTYPTVSFVVVDDAKVKVDYVLPHRRVEERPLLEYAKGKGDTPTMFDPFQRVFEALWEDGDTVKAPYPQRSG